MQVEQNRTGQNRTWQRRNGDDKKNTTHHMTKSLCPTIALISNIEELLSVNAVDGLLFSVLQKSHINVVFFSSPYPVRFFLLHLLF